MSTSYTTNLDPSDTQAVITPRTSAIVAVHNFGNPAEVIALEALAHERNLKLVFDAAHASGSLYRQMPLGSQGDAQVFSLSPTKLVIGGEGGLVATNNGDLAERIRVGREYGHSSGYDCVFAGLNGRMPEINALTALRSLQMLEDAVSHRNRLAALYRLELSNLPGLDFQRIHPEDRCSYKDFSITIDAKSFGLARDQLAFSLKAENINTRAYYSPPVHLQTAYRKYDDGRPLRHTLKLSESSLSLPIWSHMNPTIVSGICSAIKRIHFHAGKVRGSLE